MEVTLVRLALVIVTEEPVIDVDVFVDVSEVSVSLPVVAVALVPVNDVSVDEVTLVMVTLVPRRWQWEELRTQRNKRLHASPPFD